VRDDDRREVAKREASRIHQNARSAVFQNDAGVNPSSVPRARCYFILPRISVRTTIRDCTGSSALQSRIEVLVGLFFAYRRAMQVLVADDDLAIRNLLATGLRRLGLSVDVAKDGAEALEHIERSEYSVVLLDMMMPRLNGIDVLNRLKAFEKRPVVLLLTAMPYGYFDDLDSSIVAAIIRKPFDFWQVTEVVAEMVASVEKQRAAHTPPGPNLSEPTRPVC
jgi:CheY-like chemotaxis protein